MKCTNCNAEIPDRSKFCSYCGHNTDDNIESVISSESVCLDKTQTDNYTIQKPSHKWRNLVISIIIVPLVLTAVGFVFLLGYTDGNISETIQIVKDVTGTSPQNSLVKKGLFNVEITVPPELIQDKENTLDGEAKKAGVKKIVENKDGSMTMTMTRKAHKRMMSEMKDSVDDSIKNVLNDPESTSSFETITYNDSMSVFDINVDSSFSEFETLTAIGFYFMGGMYQVFDGIPEDDINITVNFINIDDNKTIESCSSGSLKDFGNKLQSLQDAIVVSEERVSQEEVPAAPVPEIEQSPPVEQIANNDFVASYMPSDGTYINSTNGGFPNTCEIRVTKVSNNSFKFSIWQVIDENRNGVNKIIFMENVAVFDSPESTNAVFRGQTYTIQLDCRTPYNIVLSGFDQATSLSNNFLNMSAKFRSFDEK